MEQMIRTRQVLAGLALAILAAAGIPHARAQAYPSKPIRIVVPAPPGGLTDIGARLIAPKLADALGQQVIAENRVGAGGTIATLSVVRSAPDGHTLLAVFDSHSTNPHLFKKLEYDTLADLTPISLLLRGPRVLAVSPRLAATNLNDFVQLAKSKPGTINFAVVGPGSPARMMMELLKLEAGIDVTMVAYKGAGSALTDVVSGQVDAMFATVPSVSSYLKAGRLRPLAVTSEARSPSVPGVPAMKETYPGFAADTWVGLVAPARTPPEIVARLNAELVKILELADLKARFAELGQETVGSTPAQFDRWIRAEIERWGKVIREQKITLE